MNLFSRVWQGRAMPDEVRYARALRHPEAIQRRYLNRWLATHSDTVFGRAHHLQPGMTMEQFQRQVPVRTAPEFSPWLEAVERGEPGVLSREPVTALLPTSGSVGGRKLIPWTRGLGREFRAALHPWVTSFMHEYPRAWSGRAYWSVSPPAWPASRSSGGLPIGFDSDSAYLGGFLARWVEHALAVPPALVQVTDPRAWSYLTLAFLLRAEDLTLISIWSPTFLLSLLSQMPAQWEALLSDLESGRLHPPGEVDPEWMRNLDRNLGRHPERAHALRALGPSPAPAALWPRLSVISCWCDSAAAEPARMLAGIFPGVQVAGKGLWATEGVVSVPRRGARHPTLALTSHLLEFVDEEHQVRTAWQLRVGETYRVLLTTGGGLCRYDLGDRIRVTDMHQACPCVEFIGRTGHVTDLCGEKLEEPFVRACWEEVVRPAGLDIPFALVAPEVETGARGYSLLVAGTAVRAPWHAPELARILEEKLHANVHYAHARRMGQLAPLRGYVVAGGASQAWAQYQGRLMAEGRRAGDIKPAILSALPGWRAYLIGEEGAPC